MTSALVFLLLCQIVRSGEIPRSAAECVPSRYWGTYRSKDADLTVDLHGAMCSTSQGYPLKLPAEKRHYKFKHGIAIYRQKRAFFLVHTKFLSPNQIDYYEASSSHFGYWDQLKATAEREKMRSEMKWRLKQNANFPPEEIEFRLKRGQVEMIYGGVVLGRGE